MTSEDGISSFIRGFTQNLNSNPNPNFSKSNPAKRKRNHFCKMIFFNHVLNYFNWTSIALFKNFRTLATVIIFLYYYFY